MIQFKRIGSHAMPVPQRATAGAAGFDLSYVGLPLTLRPGQREALPIGFACAIPEGFVGRIVPRSGLAARNGLDTLAGTIDSDYRGELKVMLINHGAFDIQIANGDRIAQMLIQPVVMTEGVEVQELDGTERGEGGFGSTGIAVIRVPDVRPAEVCGTIQK